MKPGQDRITSKLSTDWDPDHVPGFGEICFNSDTGQYKYGDGVTKHADLKLSTFGLAAQSDLKGLASQDDIKSAVSSKADVAQVVAIATQVATAIVSSNAKNVTTVPNVP